jgi:serine/threonine protein kinase
METVVKAGRYEIVGELGRGAMGVVYRAKDPVIGRTVAVKTIRLSVEGTGVSRPELVRRFQTEARAAGLLAHPNIVVVYDAGEEDGLYYITMELVEGKSLQSMLDAGQRFPVARVLRIAQQICSALQFAHERNVVHRDIKPANIMITGNDIVKVTDFGTAKILQYGTAQQTGHVVGTPSYMSPEQAKGKAVDGRSDIFSVGVMLYEMISGQKPFPGEEIVPVLYKILSEDPPPLESFDPTIPAGISSAITRALAKDPADRHQSCNELLEDLRNGRAGGRKANANVAAPPPPVGQTLIARPVAEPKKVNFQAEMPTIPGVQNQARPRVPIANLARINPLLWGGLGLAVVGLLGFFVVRAIVRPKRPDPNQGGAAPQAQVSIPAQPAETLSKPPVVSQTNPEIATLSELAVPWSSKRFFFRNESASTPALIIRLPGGAPTLSSSYWAFSLSVPFSECQFEYITDLARLSSEYGIQAKHPMVGNPCSHAVFDPLQLKEMPGSVLVRGAIVQGWDTRPPYGIEVSISRNRIRALRIE